MLVFGALMGRGESVICNQKYQGRLHQALLLLCLVRPKMGLGPAARVVV
jgi:hypothetical protein